MHRSLPWQREQLLQISPWLGFIVLFQPLFAGGSSGSGGWEEPDASLNPALVNSSEVSRV